MGAKKSKVLVGPINPCAIGCGSVQCPPTVAPIYNQVSIAPIQCAAFQIASPLSAAPTLGFSDCGCAGLGTLGSHGSSIGYGF